jgi:hypothetical protein
VGKLALLSHLSGKSGAHARALEGTVEALPPSYNAGPDITALHNVRDG